MASHSHSRFSVFDQSPPPLFRQGSTAFSRLVLYCALALFLMVADARFKVTQPLRITLSAALYPLQWTIYQPIQWGQFVSHYFQDLEAAQQSAIKAQAKLTQQVSLSLVTQQLQLENQRLRALLQLRDQPETSGIAAQIIYDAADPFTRKVIIDKGLMHDLYLGSPVLDEFGVVGQVTRLYPLTSEVTLLIDRDHAIPVLNTRTGARSVAYGDPSTYGGTLELRFMAANSDVLVGDILTTSGVDGIYPAGLPVAKIDKIERRADTPFAKIHCTLLGKVDGTTHVMLLKPVTTTLPNALIERAAQEAANSKKVGKR